MFRVIRLDDRKKRRKNSHEANALHSDGNPSFGLQSRKYGTIMSRNVKRPKNEFD